ncbi:MAG: Na+/H+ antiporter NhaA [Chitinophagaceae bacterium]
MPIGFLKNKFIDPLKEFIEDSRAIGITLLICTALSLVLANSTWGVSYQQFWHTEMPWHTPMLPHSLEHFINDGLMAVFFLLAGLEIKSELIKGELSSLKKSILPIGGAIGGMAMPAVFFILFNVGSTYVNGWAIPTATDIAFSLGVASLLGNRVPIALKIFLTALAIIDDLGAIVVIALFYGGALQWQYLIVALVITGLLFFVNQKIRRFSILQVLLSISIWFCMYNSGIHATVAGVLVAFTVPVKQIHRLELQLHNWVYFLIMPVFALANTAIAIDTSNLVHDLTNPLSLGIIVGLVVGKPAGIILVSYLLVKTKVAHLPTNTRWMHMIGAGLLAGIGFTMSIFIATLAFSDILLQNQSKLAVLTASVLAIVLGYMWLSKCASTTTTMVEEEAPTTL